MNQTVLFRCAQCGGDLLRNLNSGADVERTHATNALLQRLAFDQFHCVKKLSCLFGIESCGTPASPPIPIRNKQNVQPPALTDVSSMGRPQPAHIETSGTAGCIA